MHMSAELLPTVRKATVPRHTIDFARARQIATDPEARRVIDEALKELKASLEAQGDKRY
jgi:hypothetical protein